MTLQRGVLLARGPPPLGPGSWGFEGPEVMQPIVQRGGRLLLMIEARCAGPSSVGNCRAGTSSIGGAGTSSIGEIDGESSEVKNLSAGNCSMVDRSDMSTTVGAGASIVVGGRRADTSKMLEGREAKSRCPKL